MKHPAKQAHTLHDPKGPQAVSQQPSEGKHKRRQQQVSAEAQGSGGLAGSSPGKGQGGLSGSYPNQGAKRGVQPGAARNRH